MTKRKLCPFDKTECVGETCMLFSEKKEICSLLILCSPGNLTGQDNVSKLARNTEPGNHERKSRFKAELFD